MFHTRTRRPLCGVRACGSRVISVECARTWGAARAPPHWPGGPRGGSFCSRVRRLSMWPWRVLAPWAR
eukprot:3011463-Prymnesium_polylepis.1